MNELSTSLEVVVVIVAVCGVCLTMFNSCVLAIQSWADRHKVTRLVITRESEKKKRESRLIESIKSSISEASTKESGDAGEV